MGSGRTCQKPKNSNRYQFDTLNNTEPVKTIVQRVQGEADNEEECSEGVALCRGMHPGVKVRKTQKTDSGGHKKEKTCYHQYLCPNDHLSRPFSNKVFRNDERADEVQNRVSQCEIYEQLNAVEDHAHK